MPRDGGWREPCCNSAGAFLMFMRCCPYVIGPSISSYENDITQNPVSSDITSAISSSVSAVMVSISGKVTASPSVSYFILVTEKIGITNNPFINYKNNGKKQRASKKTNAAPPAMKLITGDGSSLAARRRRA
jgi:hypothetical protein